MKLATAAMSTVLIPLLFLSSLNVSAQLKDSLAQSIQKPLHIPLQPASKKYLTAKSIIIPVTFISYGFSTLESNALRKVNLGVREEVTEDMSGFHTKADDYLQYAPTASVYLLNAVGIKGRHEFVGRTIILAISSILSAQLVIALKYSTHQLRPDGSSYNSFPSGHTTTAFVGAEMMNQEFGWRSPWYSVAGYAMASGTAALRVMNNRHWMSDVIAGAGFGMLSTKFSYWLYSKWENRHRSKQSSLLLN
jgi:hypothetical protein